MDIKGSMTRVLGGCVGSSESGRGGSSSAHFLGKGSPETGGHFCSLAAGCAEGVAGVA